MKTLAFALTGGLALIASGAQASEGDGSKPGLLGAIHPEIAGRFMVNVMTLTPAEQKPPLSGGGPGVRAGVSFFGFYGGLSYVDFLSEGSCLDSYPGSCGSTHAASYGVELGYEHTFFGRLVLRGLLGVGDRVETASGTTGQCSGAPPCSMVTTTSWHGSRGDFYLAPSVLAAVTLGPVLIAADATLVYMPSAGAPNAPSAPFASISPGAQLGFRL